MFLRIFSLIIITLLCWSGAEDASAQSFKRPKIDTLVFPFERIFGLEHRTIKDSIPAIGGGWAYREQPVVLKSKNLQLNLKGSSLLWVGTGKPDTLSIALNQPEWDRFSAADYFFALMNVSRQADSVLLRFGGHRSVLEFNHKPFFSEEAIYGLREKYMALTAGKLFKFKNLSLIATVKKGDTATISLSFLMKTNGKQIVIVDSLGQRKWALWPEKVTPNKRYTAEEVLITDLMKEKNHHLSKPNPDSIFKDPFGGWVNGPSFTATGYFRTLKWNNRWFFVTPTGKLFWSLGVTGVRTVSTQNFAAFTQVKGREGIFEKLPKTKGLEAACYSNGHVSFYQWNVLRKYGDNQAWAKHTTQRIKYWGLNTIGNWSSPLLKRVPYTADLDTKKRPGIQLPGGLPDVFNPAWPKYVDSLFSKRVPALAKDSFLLGYFVDNESPWSHHHHWNAAPKTFFKQKVVALAQQYFVSIDSAQRIVGEQVTNWNFFTRPSEVALNPAEENFRKFVMVEFANVYFKTVKETLSKYDPNHLYLGCRFAGYGPDASILKVVGTYADVVSANSYQKQPIPTLRYHRESGNRPILIGEFHFPLESNRQIKPYYQRFTSTQRYKMVQDYLTWFRQQPYSLGAHWYQWNDQPLTGRVGDGENQTVGLVDITDRIHPEVVMGIKDFSLKMYSDFR